MQFKRKQDITEYARGLLPKPYAPQATQGNKSSKSSVYNYIHSLNNVY